MCIIIAKYRNGRLPNKNELKNSFEYNSDGAGFMYVNNDKVVIDKGYMDYDKFIGRFEELCEKYNNFDNKSLIIHCRIGTSSSNTAKNTHPYPVSNKERDLHKTYIETDLGVVHNGIISQYTPHWKKPTTNDTQEFIMKYLAPLYKNYKDFYKNKHIMNGIEDIIGSKLAFLDTQDKIYFVGESNFIQEDDGLFFSNDSYKYAINKYSFKNNKYYDWYDEWYDKEQEYYKNKKDNDCECLRIYDMKGNSLEDVVYVDDLQFLSYGDYICYDKKFTEIENDYTAFDLYNYDLYEIIDNKAYFIGNIFDDDIQIYSNEYERVI